MKGNRLLLHFLSEEALYQIEETAYRLLDEVGVSLQHAAATERLHGLGCRIEKGRAYIPHNVVQWALGNVSGQKSIYMRDGSLGFTLGEGQIRFHNSGSLPFIYDIESGVRRLALVKDVAELTRLLDALPNVDVVFNLFGPQDVPPELLGVAATLATLRNTRKPIGAAAAEKPEPIPFIVEMASACCGGMDNFRQHPNISISASPISPMTFNDNGVASIMAVAESGTPLHAQSAPSLGATAPITLAGALAQQHAEVLACIVIAASTRRGTPVVYCSRINPIDLRNATSSWGGPEVGMTGACASQLAHRLGLPCDTYGLASSANLIDPQFAYERLANAFMPALAGVDLLSGVGSTDSLMVGGPEIAVIDDEMIGLMKRIIAGCEVNDETLAFDVMKSVILRDGVFLSERHTVQQIRKGALWVPGVSERGGGATGAERVGVVTRAKSRAKEIMQTHQVQPLDEDTNRHLDEIMERARRELVKN